MLRLWRCTLLCSLVLRGGNKLRRSRCMSNNIVFAYQQYKWAPCILFPRPVEAGICLKCTICLPHSNPHPSRMDSLEYLCIGRRRSIDQTIRSSKCPRIRFREDSLPHLHSRSMPHLHSRSMHQHSFPASSCSSCRF